MPLSMKRKGDKINGCQHKQIKFDRFVLCIPAVLGFLQGECTFHEIIFKIFHLGIVSMLKEAICHSLCILKNLE